MLRYVWQLSQSAVIRWNLHQSVFPQSVIGQCGFDVRTVSPLRREINLASDAGDCIKAKPEKLQFTGFTSECFVGNHLKPNCVYSLNDKLIRRAKRSRNYLRSGFMMHIARRQKMSLIGCKRFSTFNTSFHVSKE